MPILVSCCLKGGVGKSTLAVHVAGELADRGRAVVLIDADRQGTGALWAEQGEGLFFQVETDPLDDDADDAELSAWCARIVKRGEGRTVVLDIPPHVGPVNQAALALADLALIPVTASLADIHAAAETIAMLGAVRAETGGSPKAMMVANRVQARRTSGRDLPALLSDFGEPVGPAIGDRAAFADAILSGETVSRFAPRSKAAEEIGALVDQVEGMLS